ncbi:MAG: Trk system potassium transporter TrkA [Oscillospiraceae bacterium]
MKIIIIGDGKVGYNLAENLSKENNDVIIIDKNPEALRKAGEYLDVMCIRGNGLSTKILLEAGVTEADLLIAATTSDEMNMVCCLTAKKLGAEHTIARIRDPEYADELSQLKADLDLDMVINPEQAVAGEIARLLEFPPAVNVEMFAKGRVEMVEMKVTPDMPIVGMSLKDISKRIASAILIGGVLRNNDVIIPKGDFIIKEDDTIYIVGRPSKVFHFCRRIGIHVQKIKSVMIMGGGRIAYYLAKYLNEMEIKVKIIEIDRDRCVELTELLPHSLIINGDGSDESVLHSESLSDMGAFISVTGRDEENLITALLAKQYGVQKVVAKINRMNYSGAIKNMGIDNVVSPKLITANYILRYVRGLQNAMGNPVDTLYRIMGDRVEVIEFTATALTSLLDTPLKKLKVVEGVLVAAIVRKNEIIIPHGSDVIKSGDNVILIAKDKKLTDLNDIVEQGE